MMACPFIGVCTKIISYAVFSSFCYGAYSTPTGCGEYENISRDNKLPKDWLEIVTKKGGE